jgi:hypothetical protein
VAEEAATPSDKIRDAGKWLIGASAAVGAALIAGSQLSDLGALPLCVSGTLTCLRLPLAALGAIVALGGIAYVMWRAVQVLLPVEVTIDDLIENWQTTLGWETTPSGARKLRRTHPDIAYFRDNATQIGNTTPQELKERRTAAWNRLADLRAAAVGAAAAAAAGPKAKPVKKGWFGGGTPSEPDAEPAPPDAVAEAEAAWNRARESVADVLQTAQYQRLLGSFQRLLRRLLIATVVTALGITTFAWASNPGDPSADLSGRSLVGAQLQGADLSQASLSDADLSRANLAGARLDGAALDGVTWSDTTCPDGTNSDASQPPTCLGHLSP